MEKKVDFDITYIDIKHPPDWFMEISPFGKVPVLRCGDIVLFESAVINEYIDDSHPPSLFPANAMEKAQHRACIEFGSYLNMDIHAIITEPDVNRFSDHCARTKKELARVEEKLSRGPFYSGDSFSLVDITYAPVFMRLQLLNEHFHLDLLEGLTKMQNWARTLACRETVKRSVVPEFPQLFLESIAASSGYINTLASTASR
jgi:glutathione S-transferase